MIQFPPYFVKIKYPGYFWNVKEQVLYSIKIHGVLTPLKLKKAFRGMTKQGVLIEHPEGYGISFQGKRKHLPLDYLKTLSYSKLAIEQVDIK